MLLRRYMTREQISIETPYFKPQADLDAHTLSAPSASFHTVISKLTIIVKHVFSARLLFEDLL